jgi:hypothetical protein
LDEALDGRDKRCDFLGLPGLGESVCDQRAHAGEAPQMPQVAALGCSLSVP